MTRALFAALLCCTPLLSGCGARYLPADATVVRVERRCLLEGSQFNSEYARYADCTRDPKFATMRGNFNTGPQRYVGTAIITVGYVSPVDNSSQLSTLTFDADDRGFYVYRVNDPIRIEVREDDHLRIRPA